jgi:amino acid transporter
VLTGAALLFFVYLGFEDIANLAEEAKQPTRDVPRSIFLSLGLTTLLYVLVGCPW